MQCMQISNKKYMKRILVSILLAMGFAFSLKQLIFQFVFLN